MSWQNYALKRYLKQNMKKRMITAPSIEALRLFLSRASETFMPATQSVKVSAVKNRAFNAEWLEPSAKTPIHILYLHGGSFFLASAKIYRNIPAALADSLSAQVLNLGYPLAPEASYPEIIDSVRAAYDYLLDEGASPDKLVLVGNEAGACLLFNLLKRLKEAGECLPAAMVALSPLTDLSLGSGSITANASSDSFLSPELIQSGIKHLLDGSSIKETDISPVTFDLRDFPPTFIQASLEEILADDAKRITKELENAGVQAELDLWKDTPHTWQLAISNDDKGLPEASEAIERIVKFIESTINA